MAAPEIGSGKAVARASPAARPARGNPQVGGLHSRPDADFGFVMLPPPPLAAPAEGSDGGGLPARKRQKLMGLKRSREKVTAPLASLRPI